MDAELGHALVMQSKREVFGLGDVLVPGVLGMTEAFLQELPMSCPSSLHKEGADCLAPRLPSPAIYISEPTSRRLPSRGNQ